MEHLGDDWVIIPRDIILTNEPSIGKPSSHPSELPMELLLNIFMFLKLPQDLVSAELVCKRWSVVAHDTSLSARQKLSRKVVYVGRVIRNMKPKILSRYSSLKGELVSHPDIIFELPYRDKKIVAESFLKALDQRVYIRFSNGALASFNLKNHAVTTLYTPPEGTLFYWIKVQGNTALIHESTGFKLIDLTSGNCCEYSFNDIKEIKAAKFKQDIVGLWGEILLIFRNGILYQMMSDGSTKNLKKQILYKKLDDDVSYAVHEDFLLIQNKGFVDIWDLNREAWHWRAIECDYCIPLQFFKTTTLFIVKENFHYLLDLETRESKPIKISKSQWTYDCSSQHLLGVSGSQLFSYNIKLNKQYSYQFLKCDYEEYLFGEWKPFVINSLNWIRRYGQYYVTSIGNLDLSAIIIWEAQGRNLHYKCALTDFNWIGGVLVGYAQNGHIAFVNLQDHEQKSSNDTVIVARK